eukprot:TRINITY_DN7621_c0_g1_i17.p1 TRINITY_DN7621_c0_g1~~TRINITY_DN7621_c0_g1_i17.p1  ORF type:complete len:688 (+),score=91.08 TRINITY_DN7621_c0_g1_i17:321-2384(+)
MEEDGISREFDGDDNEIEMRTVSQELNSVEMEKKGEHLKEVVIEPQRGMIFGSIEEVHKYYASYARQIGFAVAQKTSKKGSDGKKRFITIACTKGRKPKPSASNPVKPRPQSRTNCKAALNLSLQFDGKWLLNSFVLDHNHDLSPNKARYHKSNRVIPPHVKKQLELNDKAGIRLTKTVSSSVVEAGGHGNLTWLAKDARNYVDKLSRLELKEGDAEAMLSYFKKMQQVNGSFFYVMDLDTENRVRNIFWADARSRAAFAEFGDVITFDTTYLVNKYDMPFAPFVGVNHHGHSVLLGCGLISREDTETFVWLFQSWLDCMSGSPPNAIITDQDKAMQNAIEIVFPKAQHRWCLWHILKKVPEKLREYNDYESIKFHLLNVVYDSMRKEEFEENWAKFIKAYQLEDNEWLAGLYDERSRWVPAFVKDIFWAGMSTTERSESMRAFFDGYIKSKTTLKQFVEQYDDALSEKVQLEAEEDARCFNVCIPCVTPYEFERQFQEAYTLAKFQEFQNEIAGKIRCNISSVNLGADFSEFDVEEDVIVEENNIRPFTFHVHFNEISKEANCTCQLFEFRGILCKHIIVVYLKKKVYHIPGKYILERWSKTVRRSHTKIKIMYGNWERRPEGRRYDKMLTIFNRVSNKAMDSDEKSQMVMSSLLGVEAELDVCKEVTVCNRPMSIGVRKSPNFMS